LKGARADQSDLRLYDSAGREVPYMLRVRRDVATSNAFPAREFNRGADGAATQVSLDMGERPQQHNQVDIETAGNNFRRLVDVQGSPDGAQWTTLAAGSIIFRFAAAGRTVVRGQPRRARCRSHECQAGFHLAGRFRRAHPHSTRPDYGG